MKFKSDGYLTPGIHEMTWDEFVREFNFSPQRKKLLEGLFQVTQILKECGSTFIYIDGSFVTDKLEPNDWDACFNGDREVCKKILVRDAILILDEEPKRKLQKEKYCGELYHIHVPYGYDGESMLDFFQKIKYQPRKKKGIIKIKL